MVTAYLNPDRPSSFRRLPDRREPPVVGRVMGPRAWPRARCSGSGGCCGCSMIPDVDHERFLGAFLVPPLYSLAHDVGRGTVWTGVYDPQERDITYAWPTHASPAALRRIRGGTPSRDVPAVATLGLGTLAYRGTGPQSGVLSTTSGVFRTTRRPEPSRFMT